MSDRLPHHDRTASDSDNGSLIPSDWDWLRREDPVHWSASRAQWIVTRHADVRAVLRNPDLRTFDFVAMIRRAEATACIPLPSLRMFGEEALNFKSGPGHLLARRYLGNVIFNHTPATQKALVERVVAEQFERLRRSEDSDVITDLARAVPSRVMGSLLGIPDLDMAFLAECAQGLIQVLDQSPSVDLFVELNSRTTLGIEHLTGLLQQHAAEPHRGELQHVLSLNASADAVDLRVFATRIYFLFVAGIETITAFLALGMAALLEAPTQRSRWAAEEVKDASAVEELLRFTSPAIQTLRVATADVTIGSQLIPAGQTICAAIEAANYDPAVFSAPYELDLSRTPCPHLSFSDGVHACLGASLGRMQGAKVLSTFARLPLAAADFVIGPVRRVGSLKSVTLGRS